MKKIILGAILSLGVAAVPFAATHADPFTFVPACVLSLDPTLHYETASFQCQEFTDPDTGIHYNAIDVTVPAPNLP